MVGISEVDLSSKGVTFPASGVGLVVAQPFLELEPHEPFRCSIPAKAEMLEHIKRTLDVSLQRTHGQEKTHFTVFPECVIPGTDGISIIDAALAAETWPCQTVVIAGVDALTKAEFESLTHSANTYFDAEYNSIDRILENNWINCCIVWAKGCDGQVFRWLQPKISPAWVEQDTRCQEMFEGRSVFMFRGQRDNRTSFSFFSLICYDWIAKISEKRVWNWVLDGMSELAEQRGGEQPLSWVFVLQHNKYPSHSEFLNSTSEFFDQTVVPNIRRDATCLLLANNAGAPKPGVVRTFGTTAVVCSAHALFTSPTCAPTFTKGDHSIRESHQLDTLHDVVFRENGACIHSFLLNSPRGVRAGSASRVAAIEDASVFAFEEHTDPRAPNGPVPAAVKWVCDQLDEPRCLSKNTISQAIADHAPAALPFVKDAFRKLDGGALEYAVNIACAFNATRYAGPKRWVNASDWSSCEQNSFFNVFNAIQILKIANVQPQAQGKPVHASFLISGILKDIVVVAGQSHEDCDKHAERAIVARRRPMFVITRDQDNNPRSRRSRKVTDIVTTSGEFKITDPTSAVKYLAYRQLLDVCAEAVSDQEVQGAVCGLFE